MSKALADARIDAALFRLALELLKHLARDVGAHGVDIPANKLEKHAPVAATQLQRSAALPSTKTGVEGDIVIAHVARHVDVVKLGDAVVGGV